MLLLENGGGQVAEAEDEEEDDDERPGAAAAPVSKWLVAGAALALVVGRVLAIGSTARILFVAATAASGERVREERGLWLSRF